MLEYFDADIVNACKTLFGREASITRDFVHALGHDDLKSAFRKKAFETHPDLHSGGEDYVRKQQSDLFMGVRSAYDTLVKFYEKRQKRLPTGAAFQTVSRPSYSTDWCAAETVPPRRLEIGGYLYYRGCIPYAVLIKALAWQKQQRPSIGAIAKQWNWLSDVQIKSILSFHGQPRLFGERAVHLQFLNSFKVRTLLAFQRKQQKKIGQYFVENGFLTEHKVAQMVEALQKHNAQLSMPTTKGV